MSYSCEKHGWRHLYQVCPSCSGVTTVTTAGTVPDDQIPMTNGMLNEIRNEQFDKGYQLARRRKNDAILLIMARNQDPELKELIENALNA